MKTVFVTGADRNIGLELVRDFLRRGFYVYGGKYLEEVNHLEVLKEEYPEQMTIVYADVTDLESLQKAIYTIKNKSGTLDILVHNAAGFGYGQGDIKTTIDLSDYWKPFNINALGAMRLVQAALPIMEGGLKRLCFVSSEAGAVGVAHRTAVSEYCMSKTALNMATRLMFNELRPKGYTFRLYHPGWVRSPKDARPVHGGKFEPWETAIPAVSQFIENRTWEDQLVLLDNEGKAWPF